MNKAKVGDRIKIVAAEGTCGEYHNGDTGVVEEIEDNGVYVAFDHTDKYGTKIRFFVYHTEYEVMKSSNNLKPSAEEIRENILSLRQERENLQSKISEIDKQEAEMVELLKDMGFTLHEPSVKSAEKTVLYAEDIEEDMSDPGNWQIGDVFVCTDWSNPETYLTGDICDMVGWEDCRWPILKSRRSGYESGIAIVRSFRFDCRPMAN